jgi:hypothetical protein
MATLTTPRCGPVSPAPWPTTSQPALRITGDRVADARAAPGRRRKLRVGAGHGKSAEEPVRWPPTETASRPDSSVRESEPCRFFDPPALKGGSCGCCGRAEGAYSSRLQQFPPSQGVGSLIVVLFSTVPRDDLDVADYQRASAGMRELVATVPGFISCNTYQAEDGETIAIARFAWHSPRYGAHRRHPLVGAAVHLIESGGPPDRDALPDRCLPDRCRAAVSVAALVVRSSSPPVRSGYS